MAKKERKKETLPRKRLLPPKGGMISIRVSKELQLKLALLARADARSLTSYLERLLTQHVADQEKNPRK